MVTDAEILTVPKDDHQIQTKPGENFEETDKKAKMNEIQRIKFMIQKTQVAEKKTSTFTQFNNPKLSKKLKGEVKRRKKVVVPLKKFTFSTIEASGKKEG